MADTMGVDENGSVSAGLERTRTSWRQRLAGFFGGVEFTDDAWDALELSLIQADAGPATAAAVVEDVKALARDARVRNTDELWAALRHVMLQQIADAGAPAPRPGGPPEVVMMVGVNGSGKTTTIAKLAARWRGEGRRVALVAGDTFRAAAIEQLQAWGSRAQVPVLAGSAGADPAAVVFDALSSREAQGADVVLVDTAGRLHTQVNLMAELEKIARVCGRVVSGAPHLTLLVLDATTGQNGLVQARQFTATVPVDALVLAKLDSSAKGGVAFAIRRDLGLPIAYVGTGEALGDLVPFDPAAYVEGILGRVPSR